MLSAMATPQSGSKESGMSGKKTRLYRLAFYYMRQGDQGTRMNQFVQSQMPLFQKVVPGPFGIFNVFLGPLKPGEYKVYGEFHQDTAQGVIVAK